MMIHFIQDMASNTFLLTGLLAGVLASVACGLIGPYVITRRIVFLAGAIAHVAVGGVGGAIYLRAILQQRGILLAENHYLLLQMMPTIGAVLAAVSGAIIIGVVHHYIHERADTLIGAMWAVGMSLGVLMIKFTPGYHTELLGYLFGNIAVVGWGEIWLIFALDLLIIITILLNHKRLLAICLDEQQAALQGINVLAVNILLLILVALTVVCLIQVVGLILVLALLTLPAATALHYVNRMAPLMLISIGLCLLLTTLPRMAVYGSRISPESAIVLAAAGVYLVSVTIQQFRQRL